MSQAELEGRRLCTALAACPPLTSPNGQGDELWLTVQDVVCTKAAFITTPHGSSNPIEVTPDYGTEELIAAMEWLKANEVAARRMAPTALYVALRGHATRGSHGSARAAQADLLRGLTDVPPGRPVIWCDLEECGAA
jgi:hypothetical protein